MERPTQQKNHVRPDVDICGGFFTKSSNSYDHEFINSRAGDATQPCLETENDVPPNKEGVDRIFMCFEFA